MAVVSAACSQDAGVDDRPVTATIDVSGEAQAATVLVSVDGSGSRTVTWRVAAVRDGVTGSSRPAVVLIGSPPSSSCSSDAPRELVVFGEPRSEPRWSVGDQAEDGPRMACTDLQVSRSAEAGAAGP